MRNRMPKFKFKKYEANFSSVKINSKVLPAAIISKKLYPMRKMTNNSPKRRIFDPPPPSHTSSAQKFRVHTHNHSTSLVNEKKNGKLKDEEQYKDDDYERLNKGGGGVRYRTADWNLVLSYFNSFLFSSAAITFSFFFSLVSSLVLMLDQKTFAKVRWKYLYGSFQPRIFSEKKKEYY